LLISASVRWQLNAVILRPLYWRWSVLDISLAREGSQCDVLVGVNVSTLIGFFYSIVSPTVLFTEFLMSKRTLSSLLLLLLVFTTLSASVRAAQPCAAMMVVTQAGSHTMMVDMDSEHPCHHQ